MQKQDKIKRNRRLTEMLITWRDKEIITPFLYDHLIKLFGKAISRTMFKGKEDVDNDYKQHEDVMQSIWVRVIKRVPKFDERKASASTYLYTIAWQTCIDEIKKIEKMKKIKDSEIIWCHDKGLTKIINKEELIEIEKEFENDEEDETRHD